MGEYGLISTKERPIKKFDAIILTVAHNEFKKLNFDNLKKEASIVYDFKNILSEIQKDNSL